MGQPLVFPHGVTVYDPEKCWNGYTLVPLINDGVLLFDMNGNEIRRLEYAGHACENATGRLCDGGFPATVTPDYGMQDGVNLLEIDYDGNIVWEFDHLEEIDPGRDHRWMKAASRLPAGGQPGGLLCTRHGCQSAGRENPDFMSSDHPQSADFRQKLLDDIDD